MQDAKRHGVTVLAPDVMLSDWDCKLEETGSGTAVRLGLRLVRSLQEASALAISKARQAAPFESAEDLSLRAGLNHQQMTALAAGNALMGLSGHRRQQAWDAAALRAAPPLLEGAPVNEDYLELPEAPEGEAIVKDYESLGLTLRRHPLALLRPQLQERQLMTAAQLEAAPDRRAVKACGIVTTRQQPETANGTIFISLEDETGEVQVIVHKAIWELETPFYVVRSAVLAHALGHFGRDRREAPALRLMLSDEAFSKMDETRSRSVLQFLSGTLGLQLIVAMPTSKSGAVKPEFDKEFTFSKVSARRPSGDGFQELFISEAQEKTLNRPALARLWEAHAAQAREAARDSWQARQAPPHATEPDEGDGA